ncbi:MAG: PAS domain-containing protein [Bacteroidota bacterium]
MENFSVLADTAVQLMDAETQGEELYQYIGDTIMHFSGASIVVISSIEPGYYSRSRYIAGISNRLKDITRILGFDPHTTSVKLPENTYNFLSSGNFISFDSIYELSLRTLSKTVADVLEKLLQIVEIHQVGFTRKEEVFGGATLFFRKGKTLQNEELTASFVRQAAIALQKKQAEDQLRDSERRYRHIFENAMFGMYRSTKAGKIIIANQAFYDLFGYQGAKDMKGVHAQDFYWDVEARKCWVRQIEAYGHLDRHEWTGRTRQGKKVYLLESVKKVCPASGGDPYYEGVITDITQQKQLFLQMEDIAAVQSHKIRGPVASILGLIDLMMQEENPALKSRYLDQLKLSTLKLDGVIHQVVDMTQELK